MTSKKEEAKAMTGKKEEAKARRVGGGAKSVAAQF
jgi:hypothetical protein